MAARNSLESQPLSGLVLDLLRAKPTERAHLIMRDLVDVARQQLGFYVRNCAFSPAAGMLDDVLLEAVRFLKGIPDDKNDLDGLTAGSRRELQRGLRRILRCYAMPGKSSESLEQNVQFAREEFGLDEIDTEILLLLLRYERNWALEKFADDVTRRLESASRAVSALLGIDTREAHRRILPKSALGGGGVLNIYYEGKGFAGPGGFLQIAPPLRKVMFRPYNSREEWANDIFGPPLAPSLSWEDFEHLGEGRELAARVLAGARKYKASGINLARGRGSVAASISRHGTAYRQFMSYRSAAGSHRQVRGRNGSP